MEKIVQTAGRKALGEFAPDFAHYNDDVLFGENWNNGDIDHKTRCIITVVALMSSGITDSSLKYHLENAKKAGVTRKEIAAVITHVAFYAGWPKAWAVFNMAKEVWTEEISDTDEKAKHQAEMVFPIGAPNDGFKQYFIGQSYLAPLSTSQVGIYNVTFEPGARTNWHKHSGGQILLVLAGEGRYQERNGDIRILKKGDVVKIPPEVEHWHGAAPDQWFTHISIEPNIPNNQSTWLEPVSDDIYR